MKARHLLLAAAAGTAIGYGVWLAIHRDRWTGILTNRIPAHHRYWGERSRVEGDHVLYVALGDSAALGLGASQPRHGYVGVIADEIQRITKLPVRIRNLAIDGATCAVVLADELHRIPKRPALICTIDIGANDVWTFEPARFRRELGEVYAGLPSGTLVAEIPSFSIVPVGGRVGRMNRIVHEVAAEHGLWVAPLNATTALGGPFTAIRNAAGDLFHPNDRGHRQWAEAFLPGVRARLAQAGYDGGP